MPISVSCQCGKKFSVRDEMGGKRIKCPGCSQPLSIPGQVNLSSQASDSQNAEPPIPMECRCGRSFKVHAHLKGKAIACPGCKNVLQVGSVKPPADPFSDLSQLPVTKTLHTESLQSAYPIRNAYGSSGRRVSRYKSYRPLLIGLACAAMGILVLMGVIVTVSRVLIPRSPAFPPEMVEKMWEAQNPNPVVWERTKDSMWGYNIEIPSANALLYLGDDFQKIMGSEARALGPHGPYFSHGRLLANLIAFPKDFTPAQMLKLETDAVNNAIEQQWIGPRYGTIADSRDFAIEGHPGREIKIIGTVDGEPAVTYQRYIVRRQNLFVLTVGGPHANVHEQDVRRFFNSFTLTDKDIYNRVHSKDANDLSPAKPQQTIMYEDYAQARKNFKTSLTRRGRSPQESAPLPMILGTRVKMYSSGTLTLKAIVSDTPTNSPKKPGVLFLHGGFAFGADDWDMVQPFIHAGYIVMVPILRGENGQPGNFSFFYDEVDDVLAAADAFAQMPEVDGEKLFIAGHSAGGTLAALACLASDRFRAGASFSGMMDVGDQAKSEPAFRVYNINDIRESQMRSPVAFGSAFKCPVRLFYGTEESHFAIETNETVRKAKEKQLDVSAIVVPGDHFSSVDPAIQQTISFFEKFR